MKVKMRRWNENGDLGFVGLYVLVREWGELENWKMEDGDGWKIKFVLNFLAATCHSIIGWRSTKFYLEGEITVCKLLHVVTTYETFNYNDLMPDSL